MGSNQSINNHRRYLGFTLFELLITLSLVIILMSIAVPAWRSFIVRSHMHALVNRVTAMIHFARRVAIERGQVVMVCGSMGHERCDGNWRQGQLVKVGSTVLRRFVALPKGYRLIWRSSLQRNKALRFTATGFTDGQQGSFYFCPKIADKQQAVRLVVTRSGRARLNRDKVYPPCIE